MPGFIIRLLVTAAGLALAAWIVPGVTVAGTGTLLLAALKGNTCARFCRC